MLSFISNSRVKSNNVVRRKRKRAPRWPSGAWAFAAQQKAPDYHHGAPPISRVVALSFPARQQRRCTDRKQTEARRFRRMRRWRCHHRHRRRFRNCTRLNTQRRGWTAEVQRSIQQQRRTPLIAGTMRIRQTRRRQQTFKLIHNVRRRQRIHYRWTHAATSNRSQPAQ